MSDAVFWRAIVLLICFGIAANAMVLLPTFTPELRSIGRRLLSIIRKDHR